VSRLNEGFTRPPTPKHLGLAYHGASLVLEWIEETRGFPAIVRMLREYGQGRGTADVFRSVLGGEPEQIDEQFDRWLRARYPSGRVAEYRTRRDEANQLMLSGNHEQAKERLTSVAALFEGNDPHVQAMLASIHLAQGDTAATIAALTKQVSIDENAYESNIALAELAGAVGDSAVMAASLERIMYIYPYEMDYHARLAEVYAASAEREKAVRERRAVVALQPVDRAEALYQLAVALRDAGDRSEARTQVIRALEAAPAFERAQELLLELSGPGGT
jgi:tetratricopeptide (TPR) repeat protein